MSVVIQSRLLAPACQRKAWQRRLGLYLAQVGIGVALLTGVTQAATAWPPADLIADQGGPRFVEGTWTFTSAIVASHYVEPVAALLNVSRYVRGTYAEWVPAHEQILGYFTSSQAASPVSYRVAVPREVDGQSIDVDNDGEADAGVQIWALFIGSNLTGDSYLEQLDQTAYRSYLFDPATGRVREGTFLVYAPDDAQGFPSGAGPDGLYFTDDDPTVGLPAGYTLVTLQHDGSTIFDRSNIAAMDTIEEAYTASPDLSDLGLLESFHSLIELLSERYAYTELRGLDWEQIRQRFLPAIEAADAEDDVAAFYLALTELGSSIRDAHVFTKTDDAVIKAAYWKEFDARFAGDLGAHVVELSDGRYIVKRVLPDSPAANAGWELGTEILRIDDVAFSERLNDLPVLRSVGTMAAARLTQLSIGLKFPEGTRVTIEYRQPNETATRTATLTAVKGLEYTGPVGAEGPISFHELPGGYGYITWGMFRDPQYILATWEHFLRRFQGAPGIVIDLRGNVGGNAELMYTMASYFFPEEKPASYHWVDNWNFDEATGRLVKMFPMQVPLYAPKRDLRYDGAIAVLVNEKTASAGEYFPQFLQYHGRALVVGEYPSEGAGGAVEQVAMPGDIKFFFTKGRTYFAGTEEVNLEAKGVKLDVPVPINEQSERAKLDGSDSVLDAALTALAAETQKIAAARIAGTTWRLIRIFAAPSSSERFADVPEGYELNFAEDGVLNIKTDCNIVRAKYEVGLSGALKIEPTISTLAACPESSLADRFAQWLEFSRAFQTSEDGLGILTDPASGVVGLTFLPSGAWE